MDRDLVVKALELVERWIAAYERRLEFEQRRDLRIAESAVTRERRLQQREQRQAKEAENGSAKPSRSRSYGNAAR
jgi:hypothetical protein